MSDNDARLALMKLCRGIFGTSNLIGTDFDDVRVFEVAGRNLPQLGSLPLASRTSNNLVDHRRKALHTPIRQLRTFVGYTKSLSSQFETFFPKPLPTLDSSLPWSVSLRCRSL